MTGLEKEMNQGRKREVLYDGSLLNLVWCGNVLLLAKKKTSRRHSFITEAGLKQRKVYTSHSEEFWTSLLQDVCLVCSWSLWLQKETGQMHCRNVPWELWSSLTPQISKLEATDGWESSLPQTGKILRCIFFILVFHRNNILCRGDVWLLHLKFTLHCKFEIQRWIYFYITSHKILYNKS